MPDNRNLHWQTDTSLLRYSQWVVRVVVEVKTEARDLQGSRISARLIKDALMRKRLKLKSAQYSVKIHLGNVERMKKLLRL